MANNHGLHFCFGCAARSLPDVCPATVPQPASAPSRMTHSVSTDHHACSQHHQGIGGYWISSDQTDSFRHDSPLPLKQRQHDPKELYTVPDWNSLPKQMARLPGTPLHAASGTCVAKRVPVPTLPHSRQLVLIANHCRHHCITPT